MLRVGVFGMGAMGATHADILMTSVAGATLDEGNSSFLQRSVIVHEKGDDLTSQPAGDSGARIACGIIIGI